MNNKKETTEFRLGELFCGPGGIAQGATDASIENKHYKIIHQWATDYDKDTCNTYRKNFFEKKTLTVNKSYQRLSK